eukprot:3144836-Pyramimonas_sp.AAC.1
MPTGATGVLITSRDAPIGEITFSARVSTLGQPSFRRWPMCFPVGQPLTRQTSVPLGCVAVARSPLRVSSAPSWAQVRGQASLMRSLRAGSAAEPWPGGRARAEACPHEQS